MYNPLKISIAGSGKVARVLSLEFKNAGHDIAQIISRNSDSLFDQSIGLELSPCFLSKFLHALQTPSISKGRSGFVSGITQF